MEYVYALIDERHNHVVYVGRTRQPDVRLRNHKNTLAKDFRDSCRMEILESGEHIRGEDEHFWISYMAFLGCNLLNKMVRPSGFCPVLPCNNGGPIAELIVPALQTARLEEIATKTGLSMSTVAAAKRGKPISRSAAMAIARALKIKLPSF